MKREMNFYYFLTMIIFIICFTTSIILACRTIKVGKLAVTASILFYPMTYFIATLFAERYGKEKTFMMFNYAVFALIFMAIMLTITSCIPIYGAYDGLDKVFNMDYKLIFASILAFYASQFLNLKIYYYLEGYKGFKDVENRVNASIEAENTVIATGGSVVYCEEAMEHLKSIGTVVYLKLSLNALSKRLGNLKGRGVLLREGQNLTDLYEERTPLYEKYADIVIDEEGKDLEASLEILLKTLKEK